MVIRKAHRSIFVDERYGLIKNIYNLPTFAGLPRVHVKMAFGGNYFTAGFNTSGAGITEQSAENSAIGEYIERYSCLHPRSEIITCESDRKILPSVFNVGADDGLENYDWINAINVIDSTQVQIPIDCVYLTYRSKGNSWVTTSTGAACGESLDQCMWKGIAEIFERDAFQYIWRRQLSCPKIDIHENSELKVFFEKYIKSPNIEFSIYKMELDWNVPAVFGVAKFPNGGCVVGASVRRTWIEACKKTLVELSQSVIGYAALIFDPKRENIVDYSLINEYQDHSLLYLSDGMSTHLTFLDNGERFALPDELIVENDKEIAEYFIDAVRRIGKEAYFVDVTSKELSSLNWLVGKTIIPSMLDIEPNFIKYLEANRLAEIDKNLIDLGLRTEKELGNPQPTVPHPFP
ncbi:TPA: YcaO-like family protein [Streptococcus suis]|nr:YcaO-like family protein [Streptococcus suis]HEM3608779.1 YcaO-like family protein [Streptococcus suis]HEM3646113.1 YcaO-like family protein [Streptococcus suis]